MFWIILWCLLWKFCMIILPTKQHRHRTHIDILLVNTAIFSHQMYLNLYSSYIMVSLTQVTNRRKSFCFADFSQMQIRHFFFNKKSSRCPNLNPLRQFKPKLVWIMLLVPDFKLFFNEYANWPKWMPLQQNTGSKTHI